MDKSVHNDIHSTFDNFLFLVLLQKKLVHVQPHVLHLSDKNATKKLHFHPDNYTYNQETLYQLDTSYEHRIKNDPRVLDERRLVQIPTVIRIRLLNSIKNPVY